MSPDSATNDQKAVRGKILCVTSNFPRWKSDSTTPFVLHLAQDLKSLGWQVDVLAPHAEHGTASSEFLDGVQVERFNYLWPRHTQTVCYHGGALVNLRSNRLNFLKLPALVFFQWLAIVKRMRTGRYDAVHSHWILPQGFTVALAAKVFGIPHMLTVHGGDVFALKGSVLKHFKRFSLQKADVVTVNSSVTHLAVQSIAPSLRKIETIPMGVSVEHDPGLKAAASSIRNLHCKKGGQLVVFLGRVIEEKGIEDFILSIDLLRHRFPDARALIVGEGQDRSHFESLTKTLGLEHFITFIGWISPSEVPAYLAAADVFAGPSRRGKDGWVEAQGLTFLEAMVVGTPVVATRCGGIVDSVHDEVTGLLVDERAPAQLASAIERLFLNPTLGESLAEAARNLVATKFSRVSSAAAFSSVFEHLCAGKKNAPQ